jgi:hypothetical protein
MTSPTWQATLEPLFKRYELMAQAGSFALACRVGPELAKQALDLCRYAPAHLHEIDEGKANRWLGFVQGVMISGGLTTVMAERDFTRPLFHALKGPSASHQA